jgi:hypothetical protein
MDLPASGGRIDIPRVTHVGFTVPLLGRAEVVITEIVLTPEIIPEAQ